jgi:glucose-1-phosphate cytidylyltransferase
MSRYKVVILCGGRGSRISRETDFKPKPLIEVGGKPILWHIMQTYAHYGFKEFILCLGYKGNMIKEYFLNYDILANDFTVTFNENVHVQLESDKKIDWQITFVDTGANNLKGSRIKQIEKYIETDNFLLTYGDGIADINIKESIDFHSNHGKIATLSGVRPPSRFGDMVVAPDTNQVLDFTEKPQASAGLINGGFFVFKKDIFQYLDADPSCDFEKGPLEALAKKGEMMVYRHPGAWECMDNLREMHHLNELWDAGQAFWKVW